MSEIQFSLSMEYDGEKYSKQRTSSVKDIKENFRLLGNGAYERIKHAWIKKRYDKAVEEKHGKEFKTVHMKSIWNEVEAEWDKLLV